MDKTLQTTAWKCLPREFREEVKKMWQSADKKQRLPHDAFLRGEYSILVSLFGYRNLTSDVEGEDEVLTVKTKRVKELYQYAEEREKGIAPRESVEEWYQGYMKAMQDLFGSKCLPDEEQFAKSANCLDPKPTEPKFKVGDKVRILSLHGRTTPDKGKVDVIAHINIRNREQMYYLENHYYGAYGFSESDLEPYTDPQTPQNASQPSENLEPCTSQDPIPPKSGELKPQTAETQLKEERTEPTFTDDCKSQDHFVVNNEMVDDIINRSFADHNRLHIAAMAMAGLLANEGVSCFTDVQELEHMDFITYHAFEYADKLIKKSKEDEEQ